MNVRAAAKYRGELVALTQLCRRGVGVTDENCGTRVPQLLSVTEVQS